MGGRWQPYLGVGLSWVQEIDIDLERGGVERSYSGDGDTGYQLFAGVAYPLNDQWSLSGEWRYGSINGIELQRESGAEAFFRDLDYQPTTAQFGLVYNF